jgi:low affinity Fe/Cu permease
VAWAVTGPFFNFSDTWQLVINTGTTIVTFLMVFLIQNSQNRDAAAIQVKLDELIRVSKAQNSFIGLEHLTEEELEEVRRRCEEAANAEIGAERTRAWRWLGPLGFHDNTHFIWDDRDLLNLQHVLVRRAVMTLALTTRGEYEQVSRFPSL